MKEVTIVNRTLEIDDKFDDFQMVDLIVDGETINTGQNPVESFSFWDDLEDEVQRAIYRIRTGNPKMGFDFNLQSMGQSEEAKRGRLIAYIQDKHQSINVNTLFDVFDEQRKEIKHTGPDDNHPNPYHKMEIDCDFLKLFMASIIEEYEKKKGNV